MAGSSYLPGDAVFLPASMAAASEAAAAFSQPDLPPVAAAAAGLPVPLDPASCNVPKKGTVKSKTNGKKAKQAGGVVNITPTTTNVVNPAAPGVVPHSHGGQPLELDEAAVASAATSTNPDILQVSILHKRYIKLIL